MAIYSNGIKGLDETIIAFNKLASDKANGYVVAASKQSAEIIAEKARALVPVELGKLKRSIRVKQIKVRAKKYSRIFIDQPVFVVGPEYAKAKGLKGESDRVNYGHLVELGHKLVRNGNAYGIVKEHPFLRPAADGSKQEVLDLIVKAMDQALADWGDKK